MPTTQKGQGLPPLTVRDRATFDDPKQTAEGIHLVIVGGSPVWNGTSLSGERPGGFLARETTQV